jgi:hypothetical protein
MRTTGRKGKKLTFEHVPPKAAGNEEDVKIYAAGDRHDKHLQIVQRDSGAWYVPQFAKFVHTGIAIVRQLTAAAIEEADLSLEWKAVDFQIRSMRALPVVKQIVASLLALNSVSGRPRGSAPISTMWDASDPEILWSSVCHPVNEPMCARTVRVLTDDISHVVDTPNLRGARSLDEKPSQISSPGTEKTTRADRNTVAGTRLVRAVKADNVASRVHTVRMSELAVGGKQRHDAGFICDVGHAR